MYTYICLFFYSAMQLQLVFLPGQRAKNMGRAGANDTVKSEQRSAAALCGWGWGHHDLQNRGVFSHRTVTLQEVFNQWIMFPNHGDSTLNCAGRSGFPGCSEEFCLDVIVNAIYFCL